MHELLLESIKRTWYTCQSTWPRRTNQEPRLWANGFFKIEGFEGKRSLLSPPPPPSFHLFALAPFFVRPEFEKLIRVRTARIFGRFVREPLLRRLCKGGWLKKKKTIVQRRNKEKKFLPSELHSACGLQTVLFNKVQYGRCTTTSKSLSFLLKLENCDFSPKIVNIIFSYIYQL